MVSWWGSMEWQDGCWQWVQGKNVSLSPRIRSKNAIVSHCLWLGHLTILEPITRSSGINALIGQALSRRPTFGIKRNKIYPSTQVEREGSSGFAEGKKDGCKTTWQEQQKAWCSQRGRLTDRAGPTAGGSCCHKLGHTRHPCRDTKK